MSSAETPQYDSSPDKQNNEYWLLSKIKCKFYLLNNWTLSEATKTNLSPSRPHSFRLALELSVSFISTYLMHWRPHSFRLTLVTGGLAHLDWPESLVLSSSSVVLRSFVDSAPGMKNIVHRWSKKEVKARVAFMTENHLKHNHYEYQGLKLYLVFLDAKIWNIGHY